eukprot:9957701-Alexandrium_andersonii.AAC.1
MDWRALPLRARRTSRGPCLQPERRLARCGRRWLRSSSRRGSPPWLRGGLASEFSRLGHSTCARAPGAFPGTSIGPKIAVASFASW